MLMRAVRVAFCAAAMGLTPAARSQTNPLLFVTQVPIPADFTTVTATFGNHRPDLDSCGRGGDLWIRYADGTLRNLTQAAGFGRDGDQSTNGIAVREPCVHWEGRRALFAMVVGAPRFQYDYEGNPHWQIYEITGFATPGEAPVISRVPGQPADFNNVSPAYTPDDQILFTSDRPRSGEAHLHPQLDEYEEAPTVTGLWKLDPATGALQLLNHTPSGAFSPSVDSFGRVLFVRWDHLQQDQQADADRVSSADDAPYGTFNYADESATAAILTGNRTEVFPESRTGNAALGGHVFNQFFPWQINDDGTDEETLNHIGRHELGGSYRAFSFRDDPNLGELYYFGNKDNTNTIGNLLQLRESASAPGLYLGIDAPEFGTHAAGQIVRLEGAPSVNPGRMRLEYLTPRSTSAATGDGEPAPADHTGLYRNPLQLADGTLVAVHTAETRGDRDEGTEGHPVSRHDFRLKRLRPSGDFWVADTPLTPGLRKTVIYWSPDQRVSYTNTALWELDPAEVRVRPRPAARRTPLAAPEQSVFEAEGVVVEDFRRNLATNQLALLVGRNATTRDEADFQQPFNLRVPGGAETIGAAGKVYEVSFLQLFQGDQIRGLGLTPGSTGPRPGRRVLAQHLHDPRVANPALAAGAPTGSVQLGTDGSFAAFVPARRALTWQLTAADGNPVVRERYWITAQPGEIRTCTSCHGINEGDQAGHPAPTNSPAALRDLLRAWKISTGYASGGTPRFESSERTLDGRLRLLTSGTAGRSRILETSTDLRNWAPALTNPPGVDVFLITPAPTDLSRYYRLSQ